MRNPESVFLDTAVFREWMLRLPAAPPVPPRSSHVAEKPDDGLVIRKFKSLVCNGSLFRHFCEITSEEELADFLRLYGSSPEENVWRGLLFHCSGSPLLLACGHMVKEIKVYLGWLDEARAMRRCVALWDLLRADDRESLSRLVHWRADPERGRSVCLAATPDLSGPPDVTAGDSVFYAKGDEVIASATIHPELLGEFEDGDPVKPAQFHLQKVINSRLAQSVEARLLWDEARGGMALHFVPRDFLAGLWLQFAQAFTGNKDHGRCDNCGAWFEISRDAARESRVYCSPACKQRAYRGRRDKAVELKAAGKKVSEIAKELGSNVDTVREWLSRKPKK